MKDTGIIRDLDNMGRIVLPSELRRTLDLSEGTLMEIYTEQDEIIIQKFLHKCEFCRTTDNIIKIKEKFVCENCKEQFKKHLALSKNDDL